MIEPEEPAQSNTLGRADIAQIAAAVTAVVGVLTGLAVTGILAQAQRNHGTLLIIAFACVLASAVLWLAAGFPVVKWLDKGVGKSILQVLALVGFAGGVVTAIVALVSTQRDSERPAVSVVFEQEKRALNAHATAHGLSSNDRLVVLVSGLVPELKEGVTTLVEDPHSLYYAVLGPDSSGEVAHDVQVFVPKRYSVIGVKAWSGPKESECRTEEVVATEALPQHAQAGCLLMRLPKAK